MYLKFSIQSFLELRVRWPKLVLKIHPNARQGGTCMFYIVSAMSAECLAMQGVRASAALSWTKFSWNILVLVPEELMPSMAKNDIWVDTQKFW